MLDFRKVEPNTTLNFAKDFGEPVTGKVCFNLNWGKKNGQAVDLDAIAVFEKRGGLKPQFVKNKPTGIFAKMKAAIGGEPTPEAIRYNQPVTTISFKNLECRGVLHHGDDLTGAWAKGEYIEVDLNRIDPAIDTITFTVLSYSGHRFCDLPFASIEVFTGTPQQQKRGLISMELTRFKTDTRTVAMARLTKVNGEWQISTLNAESCSGNVDGNTLLARRL